MLDQHHQAHTDSVIIESIKYIIRKKMNAIKNFFASFAVKTSFIKSLLNYPIHF